MKKTIKVDIDTFLDENIGILTKKRCFYCNSKLYNSKSNPNEHWCSNPKCIKRPFGLFNK